MNFYTYDQNNSFGRFEGPPYIIVRASSFKEANEKAVEQAGVYFDGCESGIDCRCCGDRWSEPWTYSKSPKLYGKEIDIPDLNVRYEEVDRLLYIP
jgi:hypothetical protein